MTFAFTDREARRATRELRKQSSTTNDSPFYSISIALSALNLLTLHQTVFGYIFLAIGAISVPHWLLPKLLVRSVQAVVTTTIVFAEDGIRLDGPRRAAVDWNDVEHVSERGDLLVLAFRTDVGKPYGRRIAVPKRAFGDDGVALLTFLPQMFLGKRMLVRRTEWHWSSAAHARGVTAQVLPK